MSLALFHKVTAQAIEKFFDEQNQPLFKRADLGKYLGILDITFNFKELDRYFVTKADIKIGGSGPFLLWKIKNYTRFVCYT